jgi:hypothetical protein
MSDSEPADPAPKVSYYVSAQGGDYVIEVDPTWKLTFGAVNPGSSQGGGRYDLHCLRVWETKDKLRAVFCDVKAFRDLSIPLARKVTKETGSAAWTQDSDGSFERSESRQVQTTLVGPGPEPEDIPF